MSKARRLAALQTPVYRGRRGTPRPGSGSHHPVEAPAVLVCPGHLCDVPVVRTLPLWSAQRMTETVYEKHRRPSRAAMELIRRSIAPGDSLVAEHSDPPRSYLFESGVAVGSVVLDRTPPTCIGLFSAGALIGLRTNAGPPAYSYRAVSSVDLLEVPPAFLQEGLQRRPALREAYLRQLHERSMQTALIAACNAHHSLATRCARWLLRLHAQLGPVIPVTHASVPCWGSGGRELA